MNYLRVCASIIPCLALLIYGEISPTGMRSTISIPGGASGVLGSPDYFNLLPG